MYLEKDKLHSHFWFDLNKGQSHDVGEDSSYHIQHVVRNPKKFGFESPEHMQKHAGYKIQDIESGRQDIDFDLEHHVMDKGFARGYHWPARDFQPGEITMDVASPQHGVKALKHILPMVKNAEEQGFNYGVTLTTGHRGKNASYKDFKSAKDIEEHIGTLAPTGLKSKEPVTFRGVGQVTEPVRKKIKDAIKEKDPTAPNWKLEQEVGRTVGTWGDSVTYKNFKQCFSEAMKKKIDKKK